MRVYLRNDNEPGERRFGDVNSVADLRYLVTDIQRSGINGDAVNKAWYSYFDDGYDNNHQTIAGVQIIYILQKDVDNPPK